MAVSPRAGRARCVRPLVHPKGLLTQQHVLPAGAGAAAQLQPDLPQKVVLGAAVVVKDLEGQRQASGVSR